MANLPELTNKTLLVTGAASGIGLEVALQAANLGARVVALDIAPATSAGVTQLQTQAQVTVQRCDVSDPEQWQQVAEQFRGSEPLDYIHLNAGIQIAPPDAPMQEYQFDAMQLPRYRKMMGVNVDGVVFGLQALLPVTRDGGAIVVTSSLAGITPYSVDPLYAMSKHAVSGLVRSLGPTLASRNITINAICPGGIDTAIIPHEQRRDAKPDSFMTPANVAEEVLGLMQAAQTGKTWAKVSQSKRAFIVRAPGDRGGEQGQADKA